ncbi:MAG: divergent polysaccharide deacetylase family protein [Paracoccaceae bacterium]
MRGFIKGIVVGVASFLIGFVVLTVILPPPPAPTPPVVTPVVPQVTQEPIADPEPRPSLEPLAPVTAPPADVPEVQPIEPSQGAAPEVPSDPAVEPVALPSSDEPTVPEAASPVQATTPDAAQAAEPAPDAPTPDAETAPEAAPDAGVEQSASAEPTEEAPATEPADDPVVVAEPTQPDDPLTDVPADNDATAPTSPPADTSAEPQAAGPEVTDTALMEPAPDLGSAHATPEEMATGPEPDLIDTALETLNTLAETTAAEAAITVSNAQSVIGDALANVERRAEEIAGTAPQTTAPDTPAMEEPAQAAPAPAAPAEAVSAPDAPATETPAPETTVAEAAAPEVVASVTPNADPAPVSEPAPQPEQAPVGRLVILPAPVPEVVVQPAPFAAPRPQRPAAEAPAQEPMTQAPAPDPLPRVTTLPGEAVSAGDAPERPAIGRPATTIVGRQVDGVTIGRLPRVGAQPAQPAADEVAPESPPPAEVSRDIAGVEPAVVAYSATFDAPQGDALLGLIFLETAEAQQALMDLPFAASIAFDPFAPGAPERARAYRGLGHEIILRARGLPANATASDVAVTLAAWWRDFPEVIALMDDPLTALSTNRAMARDVASLLASDGHAAIALRAGVDSYLRAAQEADIPAVSVYRQIDNNLQSRETLVRLLDRSAFEAQRRGGIVILADPAYAPSIEVLEAFVAGAGRPGVSLAPVSALLLSR